jgi:hypothetical protein
MISDEKFQRGINILQQHFSRTLIPEAIAIWKEYLNDQLDDSEFAQAIKECILGCEFFPTAKKLAEFINGGKEVKALQEWQVVILASSRGDEGQLAYLSQRGRVALHAVGGLRVVGMAEEYQRQRIEKSFVTVYCQCADKDEKALPPFSMPQPTTVGSDDEEYVPIPEHVKQQIEQLKSKLSMSDNGKH